MQIHKIHLNAFRTILRFRKMLLVIYRDVGVGVGVGSFKLQTKIFFFSFCYFDAHLIR